MTRGRDAGLAADEGGKAAGTRLRAVLDPASAVGFGAFFAWKDALTAFLYPPSSGMLFSPLVCQAFACCLVLVVALVGVAKNWAAFPHAYVRGAAAGLMVLATLAASLVTYGVGGLAVAYPAAVVIGCATAMLLYAWADVLSRLAGSVRLGTAVAGLALASLFGVGVGQLGALPMNVAVVALGVLGYALLYRSFGRTCDGGPIEPMVFRPTSSNHFRLLLAALVMYAFVFGAVSGTTAAITTEELTRQFNTNMHVAMLAVELVAVVALVAWGRPVALSTMGRILTPVLALLLLLHVLLQGSASGWLPRLTLGFWELVQVFVLLLLIEVARSGQASLSFAFPAGWALVALGFAFGALFGQVVSLAFGTDPVAVQSVAVSLTIVAVMASSILAAARYPRVEGGAGAAFGNAASEGAGADGPSLSARLAVPAAAADPVDGVCDGLAACHGLSSREGDVLRLLAHGNTRAGIAARLCISENTVRVHVKNIYAKLHIHSKQQLIDMVDRKVG